MRDHQTPASERLQCDLRDAASINALLDHIGSGWDMLAHVAGIPGTAPAADVLKVNYLGMRLMTEGMLPLLREGGSVAGRFSTCAAPPSVGTQALTTSCPWFPSSVA